MSPNLTVDARLSPSDGERLGAEIAEICGYIHAATCHLLDLLRTFDAERYWEELGFPSCAHWLNFACGFGLHSARERLRVAHALGGLPKIRTEFAAGRLSYSKVRAMTRVADAENEDFLLMVAKHGTAHHVEKLVSKYSRAEKLQNPDYTENLHRNRELTYYYDDDGCLVVKARLPAEQGELVVKALEMAMEDTPDVRPKGTWPAGTSGDDTVEREPVAARRADALTEVAETYLNNSKNSGSTADRYQVVIHVGPHSDISAGAAPGRDSHLENGPHVPAGTSRRIGCDCSRTIIHEDEKGEPLSIGRRSRSIPPAIRRALQARDGGCRFPGCTHTKFVDGHHIRHWADGGETSLDNLVLLCRHHHRLVHEGGFDCRRSKSGEVWFEDRRNQRLRDHPPMNSISPEDSLTWMYREFDKAFITHESCAAKWHAGEQMDYEHAVWLMLASRDAGAT